MVIDDWRWSLLWAGMVFFSTPLTAHENSDARRTGRYSTVALVPTQAQTDLLQATVHRRLPETVETVGQALDILLMGSGYQLAAAYAADPAMARLLALPLPEVHRDLEPLPLGTLLTTLAGPAYRLVIDPVHRRVSFELKPSYRSLVNTASVPLNPDWTVINRFERCPSPGETHAWQRDLTVAYERRCYWLPGDRMCCPETAFLSPSPSTVPTPMSKTSQEIRSYAGFNNK